MVGPKTIAKWQAGRGPAGSVRAYGPGRAGAGRGTHRLHREGVRGGECVATVLIGKAMRYRRGLAIQRAEKLIDC